MPDIVILDVEAKDIHVTLSIPLESLSRVQRCLDVASIALPSDNEDWIYLRDEFIPQIEDIIEKVKIK